MFCLGPQLIWENCLPSYRKAELLGNARILNGYGIFNYSINFSLSTISGMRRREEWPTKVYFSCNCWPPYYLIV